jgi:hypothetical protein
VSVVFPRNPADQACGQVAQMVERSPEKAGVGGSIPSLATIVLSDLARFIETTSARFQPAIFKAALN